MERLRWLAVGGFVLAGGCSLANAPDDPMDPQLGTGGSAGTTATGGAMIECNSTDDCADDGDNCTIEECDNGSCNVRVVDPDDNDACTDDSCDAAGTPVNEVIDPDDDDVCTYDSCDPELGVLNVPARVRFEEDWSGGGPDWTRTGPWQITQAEISGLSKTLMVSPTGPERLLVRDPAKDHTPGNDNMLAGIVIGGYAPNVPGTVGYLESPEFDGEIDEGKLVLSYWRVLGSDYEPYMINRVEVRDGSMTWVEVWNSGAGPSFRDTEWKHMAHDITSYANPQMKVRFSFEVPAAGAFSDMPGWSIDDIRVGQVHSFIDDGDACTINVCHPVNGAMLVPLMADDMNNCTTDGCDPKYGVFHHDRSYRYFDDFSSPQIHWSLGPEWQIGPAMAGGNTDPGMDTTPTDDNRIAGVNIGFDYSIAPHEMYYLTSDPFDGTQQASGGGMLELSFQRWLNTDYPFFVHSVVEVFDGANWIRIWDWPNPMLLIDNAWMLQSFDISAHASTNNRIRIGFDVGLSGAEPHGGWNIDDVQVRDLSCQP